MAKLYFQLPLLQSSVSHDPSEIILICCFGAMFKNFKKITKKSLMNTKRTIYLKQFFYIVIVFTVNSDQINAYLLNKSIKTCYIYFSLKILKTSNFEPVVNSSSVILHTKSDSDHDFCQLKCPTSLKTILYQDFWHNSGISTYKSICINILLTICYQNDKGKINMSPWKQNLP